MYRKTMNGLKSKIEFHFYKEVLFFSQYTFPYATKLNRTEIISKVTAAYLNSEQFDTEKDFIRFESDSAIIITDLLELQLKYINLKSDFLKELYKTNDELIYNKINDRKMLEHISFLSN
jgi:hypothetical protein